jgi:hypothetical protein
VGLVAGAIGPIGAAAYSAITGAAGGGETGFAAGA